MPDADVPVVLTSAWCLLQLDAACCCLNDYGQLIEKLRTSPVLAVGTLTLVDLWTGVEEKLLW